MTFDPHAIAVDGYTWEQIRYMVYDDVVDAKCSECGCEYRVEPDARNYDCYDGCGAHGTVTSPLVKLTLI